MRSSKKCKMRYTWHPELRKGIEASKEKGHFKGNKKNR